MKNAQFFVICKDKVSKLNFPFIFNTFHMIKVIFFTTPGFTPLLQRVIFNAEKNPVLFRLPQVSAFCQYQVFEDIFFQSWEKCTESQNELFDNYGSWVRDRRKYVESWKFIWTFLHLSWNFQVSISFAAITVDRPRGDVEFAYILP